MNSDWIAQLPKILTSINAGHWVLQTVAMGLTCYAIPKLRITSIFGALLTVISISLVNAYLWSPSLFFKLPESLSQQAIVLFLTNGGIFWLLVKLLPGIEVSGLFPAFIAPILFSVLSVGANYVEPHIDWAHIFNFTTSLINQVRDTLPLPTTSPAPSPL